MAGTIGMFAEMDRMEAVNMMKGIELDGKKDKNIIPIVLVVNKSNVQFIQFYFFLFSFVTN